MCEPQSKITFPDPDFEAEMTAHSRSMTPYKDAILDAGARAQIELQDIVSENISCKTSQTNQPNNDAKRESFAEGRYMCTTIRPGLQFIDCDLRMLRSFDITAVWPKCISLSCMIDGQAASTINRQFMAHPENGVPHVMALGQETEVMAHENRSSSLRMSGLMIGGNFFDQIEGELADDLRPLRRFLNPGFQNMTLHSAKVLRQLMLQFQNAPYAGALGALYRESIGTAALMEFAATFADPKPLPDVKRYSLQDIAHDAKSLIEADPLAVQSVSVLARQLGTNTTTLRRSFKETFGERLFTHVRARRLEHARTMIRDGQRQITEVAYECGYSDPANFTHAYRRHFGCTPRADQL